MNIYSGDVLVTESGEQYLVAMTNANKFQLVGLDDGNRWTNDGHVTRRDNSPYGGTHCISSEDIRENFGMVSIITKAERQKAKEAAKVTETKCEEPIEFIACLDGCIDPTCEYYEEAVEEEFEITEKDINYVVSHAAIHMRADASAGQIVNKIAQDVYDYLKGKE